MMFQQSGLPADDPPGVPLIGWENAVLDYSASSEAAGFPASNLGNPATHLPWKAAATGDQQIALNMGGATVDYVAIAKHNLLTSSSRIALSFAGSREAANGQLISLLHLEGANGSTVIIDSSGYDRGWQVNGNAAISTAQFKFGASSAIFDGAGDSLSTGGSPYAFGSNDFTIDFWVRLNATGTQQTFFDARAAAAGISIDIRTNTSNQIVFFTNNAARITGTTALTAGAWNHVALTRASGVTRLFLNGVQQGSNFTDANVYVAGSLARIGAAAFDGTTDPLNGWIDEFRAINGTAIWTAAFTAPIAAYADGLTSALGNYALLLHFDGPDGSTAIVDSGGGNHLFTAVGNAQIDTAQSKFGGSSLLFDGTGDYLLEGDGSPDFTFDSLDFTIDFWLRLNVVGTEQVYYDSRPLNIDTGNHLVIYKNTANQLRVRVGGVDRISGLTVLATGQWFHIAVSRSGTNTRLFFNGVQEGSTFVDSTNYANPVQRPVIGVAGTTLASGHNGWLDEFRVVRGTALYTSTFIPPTRAADASSVIGRNLAVTDDAPIVFRFAPTAANYLSLSLSSGSAAAQAAVIYAGQLLVMERGVKIDVQHEVISFARKSQIVAGMSENGNFLGRISLAEWRESKAEFAWFTPDWYRANLEPFVAFAVENPFFWIWNPDEYPDETAFAWLADDVRPDTDPVTRRMAATISMRAVV